MCDSRALTRRDALKAGVGSLAAMLAMPPALRGVTVDASDSYLDTATRVRAWLASTAQRGPHGLTWAADPLNAQSQSYDLYNGMPGVVLFLLEYAHATGDRQA